VLLGSGVIAVNARVDEHEREQRLFRPPFARVIPVGA
jgi:hypothetical protein